MKLDPSNLYKLLLLEYGNLNWWPIDKAYHKKNNSDPRFEIITGAILTQNTSWLNVEKALYNLKSNNILDIEKISEIDIKYLKEMIRPSGFFNQKSERLKNLSLHLHHNYKDSLDIFFNRNIHIVRNELLSLNGIGPETADSILLYAGNHPVFVVDVYTMRLCERIPIEVNKTYDEIQNFFQKKLSKNFPKEDILRIYNELHSLIVIHAKKICKKKKPDCNICSLRDHCMYGKKSLK